MVEGTFQVLGHPIKSLFDTSATHSLPSVDVTNLLKIPYRGLGYILDIKTPSGRVYTTMMETDVLDI